MAVSGILTIDNLYSGIPGVSPLLPGDPDIEAIGEVQDLLRSHGQSGLPGLFDSARGSFGPATRKAVQQFRLAHGLSNAIKVDTPTLNLLLTHTAINPISSRAYNALKLDFEYKGLPKLVTICAFWESSNRFAAIRLNTDKAGLSFGLIQWAQRWKRLNEILAAFHAAGATEFVRIFGEGNPAVADGLLRHTNKPDGGVDPATGKTVDPAYDLVADPWVGRFRESATVPQFQAAQIRTAVAAFGQSLNRIQAYASVMTSERGLAYMLDLANQHGDTGAKTLYRNAVSSTMPEKEAMAAMIEESVHRAPSADQAGTRRRREQFIETSLLSDNPFTP